MENSDNKKVFGVENSSPNLPQIQQNILKYWEENNIFEKSITNRSTENSYEIFDGPPFKNGIPHYGSILQSVIKDVIPRYQTMKGKRVPRNRGRDCHGIYIEQKVQAKLGINTNKDVEKFGIENFVKACYDFTNSVVDDWNWTVSNVGRRVDMENAYETMSNEYMESVMRVFQQIWNKGLMYQGKRVSMYSTKLNTPISQFEVQADNSYADISDPAITVKFPIYGDMQYKLTDIHHRSSQNHAVQCVFGLIKKDGKYLGIYNVEKQWLQIPGGKVDIGESLEGALRREIKEEIGVDISDMKHIIKHPIVVNNTIWENNIYEIDISGDPYIVEADKHSEIVHRDIVDIENDLGYGIRYNNVIIDNIDEIRTRYMMQGIIKQYISGNIVDSNKISFLVWTTTPWTIPANLALVVHPEIIYAQIFDIQNQEYYILAQNLLPKYYKNPSEYIIIYICKGSELQGIKYKAPYDFFASQDKASNVHQVYLADYVTNSDGTGIVHTAPEFGEDDFQTGLKYHLPQTECLDEAGCYTSQIPKYQGIYYRDANDVIMNDLKEIGVLIKKESITHSVALCPRTQTPLIYKTQDNWFVNIQSIKDKLITNNEKINRVPNHIKHGRFLKSMEGAPDRCISRTRFWGTPMPVRQKVDQNNNHIDIQDNLTDIGSNNNNSNKDKYIILGSREEIYELDQTGSKILTKKEENGKTIYIDKNTGKEFNLHRPYIDQIWGIRDGHRYERVEYVLDNRLDSGSMPYAQLHYPFENQDRFDRGFPADFIGEGMGQVRAWFYVMHVLGTILFDSPAYTNVICTGTILGDDGRKMSKTFGNYPDVKPTIEKYGADAIRMVLMNSSLLVGGDLAFGEEVIKESIRKIILPLRNSYYFFTTYANIDNYKPNVSSIHDLQNYKFGNELDQWIINKLAILIQQVDSSMQSYLVQEASKPIYIFLEDLTNRYIRRSRRRFWKGEMDQEKIDGYNTLYIVLIELCKVLSPFMPFITEYIYRQLTDRESVHLEYWTNNIEISNPKLISDMDLIKQIVELGLSLRGSLKLKVKQPLQSLTINQEINPKYTDIILEELNIKELHIDPSLNDKITSICIPNAKVMGKKLGAKFAQINNLAKSGQFSKLANGDIQVEDIIMTTGEYDMRYEQGDIQGDLITYQDLILVLNTEISESLRLEGYAREIVRSVQDLRKNSGYHMTDRIQLYIDGDITNDIIMKFGEYISSETLSTITTAPLTICDGQTQLSLDEQIINIYISK